MTVTEGDNFEFTITFSATDVPTDINDLLNAVFPVAKIIAQTKADSSGLLQSTNYDLSCSYQHGWSVCTSSPVIVCPSTISLPDCEDHWDSANFDTFNRLIDYSHTITVFGTTYDDNCKDRTVPQISILSWIYNANSPNDSVMTGNHVIALKKQDDDTTWHEYCPPH